MNESFNNKKTNNIKRIVRYLEQFFNIIFSTFKKIIIKIKNLHKYSLRTYIWIGFFLFGIILVINVIIMTFYRIDSNYEYKIHNNAYIDALLPGQTIDQTLSLRIVQMDKLDLNKLQIGDSIVIRNDFTLDVYWIEEVVNIDLELGLIEATYDSISIRTFSEDEIVGQYVQEAGFFGSIYYAASFTEGYVFLTLSHILLLVGYWYVLLSRKEAKQSTLNNKEELSIGQVLDEDTDILDDVEVPIKDLLITPLMVSKPQYEEKYKQISIFDDNNIEKEPNRAIINFEEVDLDNVNKQFTNGKIIEKVLGSTNAIKTGQVIKSKIDIIEYIANDVGLSKNKSKMFLKHFAEVIIDELVSGNSVNLPEFGKFTTVKMPPKEALNPQKNIRIVVPSHNQVRLRFFKKVKSSL